MQYITARQTRIIDIALTALEIVSLISNVTLSIMVFKYRDS